ncbi:hypothetical protein FBZ93_106396 [Bradyrhizobium macuxiense]|uniref:Uncharacterized protein n=1 Tax=Bradyrhizobium macuxiense TaxID=1755647 RepID=A0A560LSJ4_9BRAD|nr:hypothetical protein FBZ93_106396 [Bradyrhizobium macuxiense]
MTRRSLEQRRVETLLQLLDVSAGKGQVPSSRTTRRGCEAAIAFSAANLHYFQIGLTCSPKVPKGCLPAQEALTLRHWFAFPVAIHALKSIGVTTTHSTLCSAERECRNPNGGLLCLYLHQKKSSLRRHMSPLASSCAKSRFVPEFVCMICPTRCQMRSSMHAGSQGNDAGLCPHPGSLRRPSTSFPRNLDFKIGSTFAAFWRGGPNCPMIWAAFGTIFVANSCSTVGSRPMLTPARSVAKVVSGFCSRSQSRSSSAMLISFEC